MTETHKRPTVRDVARAAGVSVATVSRALSRPDEVKKSTRDHILAVVRETGYTTNQMAVDFRTGRSRTLMVLVSDISNPFYAEFFKGIEVHARGRGYTLLIGDTSENADTELVYSGMLGSNKADGVLLNTSEMPQGMIAQTQEQDGTGKPVVACTTIREARVPTVRIDNDLGGAIAATHLLEQGHRNLLQVCGPLQHDAIHRRFRGFDQVLETAGLGRARTIRSDGNLSIDYGRRAANEIAQMPDRPTGVFVHNDEAAIGLLHEFSRLGISVPGEISVVGYDDLSFASTTTPGLTTVRHSRRKWGSMACDRLIDLIEGTNTAVDEQVIQPVLITRESTARPRSPD
ncbi:LacI family DNA-binding transcriptional regulator [Limimaricola pyoseonensis]|uniref:Transcriptional regulator, LacI family n=1 Tax=Limimaricola pyoseonensis TaxID=521013 RepID=A0A1G7CCN7_9RHOB|nr:LacI family DNA-binding transcriptional regulator [Limimaricola pyoseonensis]SDE37098.1 transcriptional regulator, LacI family [Limimaricola pyoseonensis]